MITFWTNTALIVFFWQFEWRVLAWYLLQFIVTHVSIYVFIYRRLALPVLVQWSSESSVASPVSPLSPSTRVDIRTAGPELSAAAVFSSTHNEVSLSFFVIDFLSLFLKCGWSVFALISDQDRRWSENKLELFKYFGPECIIVQGKAVSCCNDDICHKLCYHNIFAS